MRRERLEREIQHVVKRILPLIPANRKVDKSEFETILGEIMACVDEKIGAGAEQLGKLTAKVIRDMPNEFCPLDESERSWPALIGYLYSKYLREWRRAAR